MLKESFYVIESLKEELEKQTGHYWLVHYAEDGILASVHYSEFGTYSIKYCNALNSIIVNYDYIKMLAYDILAGLYKYKLNCQISKKYVDNTMDLW